MLQSSSKLQYDPGLYVGIVFPMLYVKIHEVRFFEYGPPLWRIKIILKKQNSVNPCKSYFDKSKVEKCSKTKNNKIKFIKKNITLSNKLKITTFLMIFF
jgi:hypothetical protein